VVKFESKTKPKKTEGKHNGRILVTSALPYVNNVPHLGNVVCVISADVYTRFLRLKNVDVISVLGTDEHGTTSETKAIEEGLTTEELCNKYYKIHKEIYDWFECDFDCFGRTSSSANAEVTIDIFNKLYKNGFIVEDILQQLYCETDKRFLADRFVEGTCPKCKYPNARGDQCENCGALLNAVELIDPKCKLCKNAPIIRESKHLFIDLPKLQPQLEQWIETVQDKWSANARTMTRAWLKEGLRLRCITRDLKWGIPVPLPGYEDKVFYSWFDAPIGYIGITKENRADWHDLWHDNTVKLVQFMGKDNIPFHTILFPSFLLGAQDNYTLMKELSVNEFLNYEGGQFSKSRNIGVFGDDAKATGISPEVFRYYLMINRPESSDTDFTWDDFQKKNNAELVGNFGNLVNRTMVFLNKSFDSKIPEGTLSDTDKSVIEEIAGIEKNIEKALENINIKEALKEIMHISKIGNQYLQENEPWKNPDVQRKATCLYVLANIVKDLSILIAPYLPSASESIMRQLGLKDDPDWDDLGGLSVRSGHIINNAELLFKKIEDADIKKFKEQFAGKKTSSNSDHALFDNKNPFHKLQLRVAKITKVERHPKAEKLYIEHIDFGDEQRVIISGLVPHYKEEELLGRKIIVVTNLEPANLRGVESNGMLLACEENGVVGLLLPDAELGSYIYSDEIDESKAESIESEISRIKNLPRIKINDFAEAKLVAKDGKVYCDDAELKVHKGTISIDKVQNGKVR
jgi:methionyl-tRNA synthetase